MPTSRRHTIAGSLRPPPRCGSPDRLDMSTPRRRRWLHQPQAEPLRRTLYQLHLWIGIALGLYIVVISVSGSAVVFRRELTRWLLPGGRVPETGYPWALSALEWLVDLHDNLLAGTVGRDFNGIGAILLAVMVLSLIHI